VCRNNDYGRFAELHFWRTPQANCRSQSRCMPYSSWARDYAQIVNGR
jgi:putative spermidine/putrescine transport system substrate-binding protein